MKKIILVLILGLIINPPLSFSGLGIFDKRPVGEQQASIFEQSTVILNELYREVPKARMAVKKAYGYATFSNFGMKIFVAGSGTGRGVAINNQTGDKTYMKMVEVQAGLGLGIKKFKLVWVFETRDAFTNFIYSGWDIGGQASAAAKYDNKGDSYQGALSLGSGVWLYQLTEKGLALELAVKGTKYFQDKKLNSAY